MEIVEPVVAEDEVAKDFPAPAPSAPAERITAAPGDVPAPLSGEQTDSGTRSGTGAVASGTVGSGGGGGGGGGGQSVSKAPEQAPRQFRTARWVVQPGHRELVPFYPPLARNAGISGTVVLACNVTRSRRLKNCYLLSETPAGYGFGAAILAASGQFKVHPPTEAGRVLEDAWVAVAIRMSTP